MVVMAAICSTRDSRICSVDWLGGFIGSDRVYELDTVKAEKIARHLASLTFLSGTQERKGKENFLDDSF